MRELSPKWIDNIKKEGFHLEKNYFDKEFLKNINNVSNAIIKFDTFFNLFGFGNRTFRNGNIFTANLLYKNNIFYDLLINRGLLNFPKQWLGEFILSEYKIITSYRCSSFNYWWHKDYPYYFGEDMGNLDIGILIPLIDFNKSVGSTVFIPNSHLLNNKPDDLDEKKSYVNSRFLETTLGDVFIYDGKLIHSGSENKSDQNRNLISLHFVKKYIIPGEDMKLQYYQLNMKDEKLKSLMAGYHLPHVNKFGANRGWEQTVLWILLKYPNYLYQKTVNFYHKINKLICRSITKIILKFASRAE